jgi:Formate dehydrogenase N, transmembrane
LVAIAVLKARGWVTRAGPLPGPRQVPRFRRRPMGAVAAHRLDILAWRRLRASWGPRAALRVRSGSQPSIYAGLPDHPRISPFVAAWKGLFKPVALAGIAAAAIAGFLHWVVAGPNEVQPEEPPPAARCPPPPPPR